jgi:hypothetical protein
MYNFLDFSSQIITRRGSLVPKQKSLIHQFDVYLDYNLTNQLLLL